MVEQPRPSDLLLVTTTQRLAPLACGVPAALTFDDVLHLHDHDLVAQRAQREVRPLRNEDELVRGRLVHDAAVHGPQPAQDPEERRLAASVRAYDEQVLLGRAKRDQRGTLQTRKRSWYVGIDEEDGTDSPRA